MAHYKLLLATWIVLLLFPLTLGANYDYVEDADSNEAVLTGVSGYNYTAYYAIPPNHVRTLDAFWLVKAGLDSTTIEVENITINSSRFMNDTHIGVRVHGAVPSSNNGRTFWYVHNGTSWVLVKTTTQQTSNAGSTSSGSDPTKMYDGSYITGGLGNAGIWQNCHDDGTCTDLDIKAGTLYEEGVYWDYGETLYDVVFYVRTPYQEYLSNANVTLTRLLDDQVIESKLTDFSGAAQFEVVSGYEYRVTVNKTGYDFFNDTVVAIETTYAITLSFDDNLTNSPYEGLVYNWSPSSQSLSSNTSYNFSYSYASVYWPITGCWFSVINATGGVINTNTSGCNNASGSTSLLVNTSSNDTLTAKMVLLLNDSFNITYYRSFIRKDFYEGSFSLSNALNTFKNFNGAGFDDDERWLLGFLGLLVLVGGVTRFSTYFGEPERVLLLIWSLVGLGSVAGLFPLSFLSNAFMIQYGALLLVTLLAIAGGIINWRLNA